MPGRGTIRKKIQKQAREILAMADSEINGMPNKKGTYALVMFLHAKRTITIGKLGPFVFDPGWYVYIGSAFGSGGLRARTNHHKRRKRRLFWHVDYLREIVPIAEIWFSYGPRVAEHDWAQLIAKMCGAVIPVRGFGSQGCKEGCVSHLIRFTNRPDVALFRREVSRRFPDRPPVYVEVGGAA